MLSVLCSAAMLCGAPMSAEAHELQLYCSNHNVWLRAEPSATTESERICIIPDGTVISVSEEYFGWGKTVCTIDGQTYTGWTALYLYSPISIEEMQPVSDDLVYSEYGVSGSRTALYQYLVNTMGFSAQNALDLFRRLDQVPGGDQRALAFQAHDAPVQCCGRGPGLTAPARFFGGFFGFHGFALHFLPDSLYFLERFNFQFFIP